MAPLISRDQARRRGRAWGLALVLVLPLAGGAEARSTGEVPEYKVKARYPAGQCPKLLNEPAEEVFDYKVKARYLCLFTEYTEWPAAAFANATTPFVIGVLGEDPFGKLLDEAFPDGTAKGRKLVILRKRRVEEVRGCHVLFISRSEKERLPKILSDLREHDARALTVSDEDSFLGQGGMIHLVVEATVPSKTVPFKTVPSKTVLFKVNLGPADRVGLKIDAHMLDSASAVLGR